MAGNEANADVLAALNQQVKAINDLITTIQSWTPVQVDNSGGSVVENTIQPCTPTINVTCGGVQAPSPEIDPPPTSGQPNSVDPPPDWTGTQEEYDNYKCLAANYIAVATVEFFRVWANLGSLGFGGLSGAAFGSAMLAAIKGWVLGAASTTGFSLAGTAAGTAVVGSFFALLPAWAAAAIVGAVAAVVVLAGQGWLAYYGALATELENSMSVVVCNLVAAQTPLEAKGVWASWMGDAVSAVSLPAGYEAYFADIQDATDRIRAWITPNAVVNLLFTEEEFVNNLTEPPIDCQSACPDDCTPTAERVFGVGLDDFTPPGSYSLALQGGVYDDWDVLRVDFGCPVNFTFEGYSGTWSPSTVSGLSNIIGYPDGTNAFYSDDVPVDGQVFYGITVVIFRSPSPDFVMHFSYEWQ